MNEPIYIPLPTPFAIGPANAYLFGEVDSRGRIAREAEVTLVDCGVDTDDSWNALLHALEHNHLTITDIDRVLITHAHVDHMGMAARIVDNSDAYVLIWDRIARWAHDTANMWQKRVKFLRSVLGEVDMAALQRNSIIDGMSRALEFWPTVPKGRVNTFTLADTLTLAGSHWEVLHMPGHSNTQTCFYQPESGQFIAADMLLPLTPAPVLEFQLDDETARDVCLPQLLHAYRRVHTMAITRVYPGHGEPFSNCRELIERQQARIAMRKEECLRLIREGHHQVGQMLDIMYSHHPETGRFTAVCTLIGYLDLLLEDGAIREEIEDGMKRYYPL